MTGVGASDLWDRPVYDVVGTTMPHDTPFLPDPVIEAFKKDIDRTLIRENLKLSVEDRFRQLMKLQEFAEALRAGRERSRTS